MSYPPPPGLKSTQDLSASARPPSSLPARPPAAAGSQSSFKTTTSATPSFSPAPGVASYNAGSANGSSKKPAGSFQAFTGFQPRSVAASSAQAFRPHSPAVSASPQPYSASQTTYNNAYQPQHGYQQSAAPSYGAASSNYQDSYNPTPPQIRNPFPLPGQDGANKAYGGRDDVDPEMEAQIAQWQSAYEAKDSDTRNPKTFGGSGGGGGGRGYGIDGSASSTGANTAPLGTRPDGTIHQGASGINTAAAANADTGVASVVTGADGKQKTVVRSGGGQTWQDPTLLEWDPAHFRLFAGNLAGEVTDESLLKAFAKYPSVQKARVVRDKRTTKSRGFGFISFADGEEYFQAARDMQGKYIGSHPVLLRKSTTEIKATTPQDRKKGGKNGKGGSGGSGYGGNNKNGGGGGGVQKKSQKTKGGLKVLG